MEHSGDNSSLEISANGEVVSPQLQDENQSQKKRRQCPRRLEALLVHTFQCFGCSEAKCLKMKQHWAHKRRCQLKTEGGCRKCKTLGKLRRYHVRRCQSANCDVPNCTITNLKRQIAEIKFRETELMLRRQQLADTLQCGNGSVASITKYQ